MTNLHETKSASRRSLVGQFLVAAPHIHEAPYRRSVVLVVQHQDEGSLGLMLDENFREHLAGIDSARPEIMEHAQRTGGLKIDRKLFSGILVWPAGHVERDIESGMWMVTPACFEMAYSGNDLWVDLLRQIGRTVLRDSLGIWNIPVNPRLN